jgi:transposase
MANETLNMKIIEEIRRLKQLGFKKRAIARALGIHRNTVTKYLEESIGNSASIVAPALLSEVQPTWVDQIDWQSVRDEILKSTPIQIVYEELSEQGKVPVTYPAFWKQLQRHAPLLKTTMARVFAPGSRIEIDYSDGIDIVDVATGEAIATELFVGVLAHSRYTFAEFTMSQKSEDFLSSHVRMFEFFGGVSQTVAPDNLKSAVTKAHRYDPVLNPAYTRLAAHYGFAVQPARVKRPQDKAIVERTIQIFQRWFFMRVRNRTFTSLVELNQCLKEHLELFNARNHRTFNRTRKEMFEESERAHLLDLPKDAYLVQTFSRAKLSRDCHLVFDYNFYSAPHTLRGLELEIWATSQTIEIYNGLDRVAVHKRYRSHGKFVTDPKHYPSAHQAYLEEDVERARQWATSVGTECAKLVEDLLSCAHPLQHLRRVQGILALSRKYSKAQLEQATAVANRFNNRTIPYLERVILNLGGERVKRDEKGGEPIKREFNPNLRGLDEILH